MIYCDEVPEGQRVVKVGERYNRLVVKNNPFYVFYGAQKKNGHKKQRAIFLCDCGSEIELDCHSVKQGRTTSCNRYCLVGKKPIHGTLLENGMKRCSRCQLFKSGNVFRKRASSKDGLHPTCSECLWEMEIGRKYNMTKDQYYKILESQGGVCAVCEGSTIRSRVKLDIDHDHHTGKIRGLLCSNCNTAIGLLRESEILFQKATNYLKK